MVPRWEEYMGRIRNDDGKCVGDDMRRRVGSCTAIFDEYAVLCLIPLFVLW